MDYRIRWRQRRLEKRRRRLLLAPAGLVLGLIIYLLLRGVGSQVTFWTHTGPAVYTPHFALGATALYVVWPDGHLEAVRLADGGLHGDGPLFSRPEPFNAAPACGPHTVYLGSDLGVLRAIGSTTGETLWKYRTDGALRGQPLLDDRRLYIGSDGGQLACLNTGDGQRLWATELGSAIARQPARVGDLIIAATIGGTVYGVEAGSGKVRWRHDLGEPVFSPVTAADPLVFLGTDRGSGILLQAETGAEVARYQTRGLVRGPAAVTGDAICFGSTDGWLRTVSRDGKQPLWVYNLGGPVTVGPCALGKRVFAGSPRRLVALDATVGRPVNDWKDGNFAGSLLPTTDTLYVGTSTGQVLALDLP